MRHKINETDIAQIIARGSGTLDVTEVGQIDANGNTVVLYKILFGDHCFAHLYLDARTYSIVWNESAPFEATQPFMFVDLQFSNIPVGELRDIKNVLPKRKGRGLHYYYESCEATLVTNQESAHEFDLMDQKQQDKYVDKFVNRSDCLAKAALVKYHMTIVTTTDKFLCAFAGEPLQRGSQSSLWEFTVRVPRTLLLKERVLIWMARDLIVKNKIDSMNFRNSLTDLHQLVGV